MLACLCSLQVGDIILDVDGVDVSGKDADFLRSLTLGQPGTVCNVVRS